MTTYKLTGFKELEDILVDELPKATTKNILKRTAFKAMKRLELRMAQLAPFDENDRDGNGRHLRDTMKTQLVKAERQKGSVKFATSKGVEVATGPAPVGKKARIAASSLERGTGPRYTKNGRFAGVLPAQPFARPAADGEAHGIILDVGSELKTQIEKARTRIARKAAKGV
jgi:hypothetical protein